MPKPKKKPSSRPHAITVRLTKSQYDAVVLAAREASLSSGFPVTVAGYAGQATTDHARLRKLDKLVRDRVAATDDAVIAELLDGFLMEAGQK